MDEQTILEEYTRIEEQFSPMTTGGFIARALPYMHELMELYTPKSVLEIGFNRGGGALAFLLCSKAKVLSIDKIVNPKGITILTQEFPDRFRFEQINSQDLLDLPNREGVVCDFDLVYIDGAHDFASVTNDIEKSLKIGTDYILFDDWQCGSVTTAIELFLDRELEVVKQWNYPDESEMSWCFTKVIK